MKKLKKLKKIIEMVDEYTKEIKMELDKAKKEHQKLMIESNSKLISEIAKGEGIDELMLIEKYSKKSDKDLAGRNSHYRTIVFPAEDYKAGEYVNVKIIKATGGTLIGEVVSRVEF